MPTKHTKQDSSNSSDAGEQNYETVTEKRRWVIIEDYPLKAQTFMQEIITHCPEDEIYWMLPDKMQKTKDEFNKDKYDDYEPDFFLDKIDESRGKHFRFFNKETISIPNESVDGFYYYRTFNKKDTYNAFEEVCKGEYCIFLVDVELPALGGINHDLNKKINALFRDNPKRKLMATITTTQVNVARIKRVLSQNVVDKQKVLSILDLEFIESTMERDCKDTIMFSRERWTEIYKPKRISLSEFLSEMAKWNQDDLHNWNELLKDEFIRKGTWHEKWDMPIQLKSLITYFGYPRHEFIKDMKLKQDNRFRTGTHVAEALKVFGTNDPATRTQSVMDVIFIIWGTYRRMYPNGDKNQMFVDVINQCDDERLYKKKGITPSQTLEAQHTTALCVEKVFEKLFPMKGCETKDNLIEITLDSKGLKLRMSIDPELLHEAIEQEYNYRMTAKFEQDRSSEKGGDTAKAIVDLYQRTGYCNRYESNRRSLLGNENSFRIYAAGKHSSNGTIIHFGYG